jgi:hypothetical protein
MANPNSLHTTKRKIKTILASDDEDEEEILSNPIKKEKKMEDNNHNRENRHPIQGNIIDLRQGSSSSKSSLPIQKPETKNQLLLSSLFTSTNKGSNSIKKSTSSSHVNRATTLQNEKV